MDIQQQSEEIKTQPSWVVLLQNLRKIYVEENADLNLIQGMNKILESTVCENDVLESAVICNMLSLTILKMFKFFFNIQKYQPEHSALHTIDFITKVSEFWKQWGQDIKYSTEKYNEIKEQLITYIRENTNTYIEDVEQRNIIERNIIENDLPNFLSDLVFFLIK